MARTSGGFDSTRLQSPEFRKFFVDLLGLWEAMHPNLDFDFDLPFDRVEAASFQPEVPDSASNDEEEAADPEADAQEAPTTVRHTWNVRVIKEMGIAPEGFVTVIVDRPYDKQRRQWDQFQPLTINAREMTVYDFETAIEDNQANTVNVCMDLTTKPQDQNMHSLNDLMHPPKDRTPLQQYNEYMKQFLVGKHLHLLHKLDFFKTVRDEFPLPQQAMDLSNSQERVIAGARAARGGLVLVHGPPGCGKTWLLLQVCKPFLRHTKKQLVLAICPSNEAANSLAKDMSAMLRKEQSEGFVSKLKYMVRLHSKATEDRIQERASGHWRKSLRATPSRVDTEVDFGSLEAVDKVLFDAFKSSAVSKFLQITDPRLELLEDSLGYHMLRITGLIRKDGNEALPQEWAQFRSLHIEYVNKENQMSEERVKEHTAALEELYQYTVSHATVIIGTTYECGRIRLTKAIEPYVSNILMDEACRERNDNLIPIARARLVNYAGFMMVGDPYQLAPINTVSRELNPFGDYFTVPMFLSLMMQGFPAHLLWLQNRFVQEIGNVVNKFMYGGRLKHARGTMKKDRPLAQAFSVAVKALTDGYTDGNVVVINVAGKEATQTSLARNDSRYNDYYVCLIINFSVYLLDNVPKAKIAILTAYSAQESRYASAIQQMKLDGLSVTLLSKATFDSAQGNEYDYVLCDILVHGTLGFQGDPRRLNVATSRARDGLLIVTCIDDIDSARGRSSYGQKLLEVIGSNRTFSIDVGEGRGLPQCKYYGVNKHLFKSTKLRTKNVPLWKVLASENKEEGKQPTNKPASNDANPPFPLNGEPKAGGAAPEVKSAGGKTGHIESHEGPLDEERQFLASTGSSDIDKEQCAERFIKEASLQGIELTYVDALEKLASVNFSYREAYEIYITQRLEQDKKNASGIVVDDVIEAIIEDWRHKMPEVENERPVDDDHAEQFVNAFRGELQQFGFNGSRDLTRGLLERNGWDLRKALTEAHCRMERNRELDDRLATPTADATAEFGQNNGTTGDWDSADPDNGTTGNWDSADQDNGTTGIWDSADLDNGTTGIWEVAAQDKEPAGGW